MKLKTFRNIAFAAMIAGALCVGAFEVRAEDDCTCCRCTGAGSGAKCEQVAVGVQGWTNCSDTFSCSVWGSACTPKIE